MRRRPRRRRSEYDDPTTLTATRPCCRRPVLHAADGAAGPRRPAHFRLPRRAPAGARTRPGAAGLRRAVRASIAPHTAAARPAGRRYCRRPAGSNAMPCRTGFAWRSLRALLASWTRRAGRGRPRGADRRMGAHPPLLRRLRPADGTVAAGERCFKCGLRPPGLSAHLAGHDGADPQGRLGAAGAAHGLPSSASRRWPASWRRVNRSRKRCTARCSRKSACGCTTCSTLPASRGLSRIR